MPNQPPSDRTRAKGGPPSPEFCPGAPGLTSGFSPKMQNEPNFRCSEQILTTNDWRLKTAFNETNPISGATPDPRPKKCETNPIPGATPDPRPKYSKRTQFQRLTSFPIPQLRETNPIYPHGHPAPPQKCETNPIYELRTTNYELFMRDLTNAAWLLIMMSIRSSAQLIDTIHS